MTKVLLVFGGKYTSVVLCSDMGELCEGSIEVEMLSSTWRVFPSVFVPEFESVSFRPCCTYASFFFFFISKPENANKSEHVYIDWKTEQFESLHHCIYFYVLMSKASIWKFV